MPDRWITTVTNGKKTYDHAVIGRDDVSARRTLRGIIKRRNQLQPGSAPTWRMVGKTRPEQH
jgi:hypothetical protein